eukprot:CAMPEP_0184741148 /NCGR_PEP_ID=MMETSP0315-20130426/4235_1 /TAXON_ID=101924 /ORGANISM="Rhodosorus marinus, Strain UTEX LB 2760" /LENGTH=928 /DNA_ID=CAMNT_0027211323 /DNA_START=602 /DNA_END=3388 /DNA_ORIENTATION=+
MTQGAQVKAREEEKHEVLGQPKNISSVFNTTQGTEGDTRKQQAVSLRERMSSEVLPSLQMGSPVATGQPPDPGNAVNASATVVSQKAEPAEKPVARRVRLTRKEIVVRTFRESLLEQLLSNYFVDEKGESVDAVNPKSIETPVRTIIAGLESASADKFKKTRVGHQFEKLFESTFTKNGVRGGVDALVKLVCSLSAEKTVNEKVRNGRLRAVEQLQLCSGRKDPAIGQLVARPQLNSIGSWMDDFVDTNNWKGVNHILLLLGGMEVSKEWLKLNKEVARRVKAVAKVSKKAESVVNVEEAESRTNAKRLYTKWVQYLKSEDKPAPSGGPQSKASAKGDQGKTVGKPKESTPVNPNEPASSSKAGPPASIAQSGEREKASTTEIRHKRPLPSSTSLPESPPAIKKAKALNDDELFGSPPAPKKRMAPAEALKSGKLPDDDIPAPKKLEVDRKPPIGMHGKDRVEQTAGHSSKLKRSIIEKKRGSENVERAAKPPVKAKKRVTWAPGDKLLDIEYIETKEELARMFWHEPPPTAADSRELTSAPEEQASDPHSMAARTGKHDMIVERQRLQKVAMYKKLDMMRDELVWRCPATLATGLAKPNYEGDEANMRSTLVSFSAEEFPNPKQVTSPVEAPFTSYPSNSPAIIPLEAEGDGTMDETDLAGTTSASDRGLELSSEQLKILSSMSEALVWRTPARLPPLPTAAQYEGEASAELGNSLMNTAEVYPGDSIDDPDETGVEVVNGETSLRVIPLGDVEASAEAESPEPGGTGNQAIALASILSSALNPSAQGTTVNDASAKPQFITPEPVLSNVQTPAAGLGPQVTLNYLSQFAPDLPQNGSLLPVATQTQAFTAPLMYAPLPTPPMPQGPAPNPVSQPMDGGAGTGSRGKSKTGSRGGNGGGLASVPCKFYGSRGGCKNGENCKFLHSDT